MWRKNRSKRLRGAIRKSVGVTYKVKYYVNNQAFRMLHHSLSIHECNTELRTVEEQLTYLPTANISRVFLEPDKKM